MLVKVNSVRQKVAEGESRQKEFLYSPTYCTLHHKLNVVHTWFRGNDYTLVLLQLPSATSLLVHRLFFTSNEKRENQLFCLRNYLFGKQSENLSLDYDERNKDVLQG